VRNVEEKTFTISGTYQDRGEMKKFSKEVSAQNENYAREKTFSLIGSKHKVKRNAIAIKEVSGKKE